MSGISFEIDILIQSDQWSAFKPTEDLKPIITQASHSCLALKNIAPEAVEISVVLTDDHNIQILNKNFRGQNKPTNVLSFPQTDFTDPAEAQSPYLCLGDIVLAYQTLEREAREQEKMLKDHFTHLCVHSLLHLFGYDHIQDNEAEDMEALEIDILAHMGIKNPYAS